MRVILLAPGLARVKRGYERFVLELAAELRRAGVDAECWGTSAAPGVEAIAVPGRDELQVLAFERLRADARFASLAPTAFQDWGIYAEDQLFAIPAAARIGELLQQQERLLVYAKWQGGLVDPSGAPTPLLELLASAALEGKASLIVHTDYIQHSVDSLLWKAGGNFHALGPWITENLLQFGVERGGILEFPLCVDASAYRGCQRFREEMRSELAIPAEAFVILSVGSFDTATPDKRHAHLLREIASLPTAENVWWVVAGSRGTAPAAWEQEAREMLGSRFIPLPNLPFERMPQIYGTADLFALASVDETFGLAYLEAQIAGLPVVIHESIISRHLCVGLSAALQKISLVDMRRKGEAASAIEHWLSLLSTSGENPIQTQLDAFASEQERRFGWSTVGPQYAAAFQNIGRSATASRDEEAARQQTAAASARREFGTWDEQTHRQGLRLFEERNFLEALMHFGRALGGRETSERWNDWATAQVALKHISEAEQGFRRAIALNPRSAQAAANLGALLSTSGRPAEAIPLLVQAFSGIDLAQQVVISRLLADCRAKKDALPMPADQQIADHLRPLAGGAFDDAIHFQRQLPYYLAVIKSIPRSLPGERLLGISSDPQILAPALARWKGYDHICWRSESGGAKNETPISADEAAPAALRLDKFTLGRRWPYSDAEFDAIFIGEALETLSSDPMHVIAEANRVLKMGGRLFLAAPNLASGQAVHAILHGKSPYVRGQFSADARNSAPRHGREYTPAEIESLAAAGGFSAIHIETRDVYWQPPDKIFPALAASGYPVGMRGDTILLLARKESPVRDRYSAKLYELPPLLPAAQVTVAAKVAASAASSSCGARSAKARSEPGRPLRVLAVHENLPRPDQSGADFRFLQTVRELRAQGHSVTYLAARGFEKERYIPPLAAIGAEVYTNDTEVLRREGIEIIPQWTLQELLRDGQFDVAVFFLWFWMSVSIPEHYLDEIRRLSPRTRIVVLTDDCHGLRELRGANLTGTWSDRERAQDYREREAEILRAADVALAISEEDRKRLLEDSPNIEIGVLPMVVEAGATGPAFDAREGLMYLADYNNPASCDGIDWYLKQVAPIVQASLPGVKVHLVGAGLRPDFAAGYPDVVPVGFVPELATEFAKHRMLIAPVRFGTGTKTKILHALAHGVPVITTAVGAEGMDLLDDRSALIADAPENYARAVVRLYSDRNLWQKLAERGRAHILKKYAHGVMAARLREALERARDLRPKPHDPAHAWSGRPIEKYFPEVLTHFPPQQRTALRLLACARSAEQLAAAGDAAEARRQLRHIFSYVSHRIPRETLFGELGSIAEIMERTYRTIGEAEGAAEFRHEARQYAPAAFPENKSALVLPKPKPASAVELQPTSGDAAPAKEIVAATRNGGKLDFSVIVPTYNRCETLGACLHALSNQSFSPRRYEVLVVDDGSTDGTAEFCRDFRSRFEFHYLRQANAGAGAARRLGVEHARAKFLLLFNDDTIADRGLLAQHWRTHRDSLGGKMAVLGDFRYPESARRRALTHFLSTEPFLFPQVTLAPGDHSKNAYFIASNLSVRREAVLDAGSFDARFRVAEDTELGVRLRQVGFHVRYVPEARSIHDHAAFTLPDLVQRAELYGRTQLLLLRKHPHLLGDGSGPFGRLNAAAIEKLRAYAAERQKEVNEALRTVEKFDFIDFEPFLQRTPDGRAASEDVMGAFKIAVRRLSGFISCAVFWPRGTRIRLRLTPSLPPQPSARKKSAYREVGDPRIAKRGSVSHSAAAFVTISKRLPRLMTKIAAALPIGTDTRMPATNNIGILTGGGDVPGLNAVIKSVVYGASEIGRQVIGIRKGWQGLTHLTGPMDANYVMPLDRENTRTIDRSGGTMLHTSRTNPRRVSESRLPKHLGAAGIRELPFDGKHYDLTPLVLRNLERLGISCLVAIGGDDTLSFASALSAAGFPVLAIPKTMDNDVQGTEYCIGFSTAVTRAKQSITRQRTTVGSHERIGIFRIFGRDAGFTALYTAYVTSTRCLIPEHPFDLDRVCRLLMEDKTNNPSHYALIVVSEGAIWTGGHVEEYGEADSFGHRKKVDIGHSLAEEVRRRTGQETMVSDLTYDLRSGEPDSIDQVVAISFANIAVELIRQGVTGRMIGVQNGCYAHVPLPDLSLGARKVNVDKLYNTERYRPDYTSKLGMPLLFSGS